MLSGWCWEVLCEVRKSEINLYLAFLDISKAYDSVWRVGLWH